MDPTYGHIFMYTPKLMTVCKFEVASALRLQGQNNQDYFDQRKHQDLYKYNPKYYLTLDNKNSALPASKTFYPGNRNQ